MSASSDNTRLLNEIANMVRSIADKKVDPDRRSLAEFRCKYGELEILDDADNFIASHYLQPETIIDRWMQNPRKAFDYLRMSVIEMMDDDQNFTRDELLFCIHRLVLMVNCLDRFQVEESRPYDASLDGHFDIPRPQQQPRKRPAAAQPIKPFGDHTPPPAHERVSNFLNRMSPEALAEYEEQQGRISRIKKGMGAKIERDYEIGPDPISLYEQMDPADMAQIFEQTPITPENMKPIDPDVRLQNLPLDENFDNYPPLGEPEDLIPDNPNKKPLFIIPDANEVKQYASARGGPTGPDENDDGLGKRSGRRAAKRGGSAPEGSAPDQADDASPGGK